MTWQDWFKPVPKVKPHDKEMWLTLHGIVNQVNDFPLPRLPNGYDAKTNVLNSLAQDSPASIYTQTIDLTTARLSTNPFIINVPGKSFVGYGFTTSASNKTRDPSASVSVRINEDRSENAFPLKHGRGFVGDFTKLYLSWPAQSGVSIDFIIQQHDKLPWQDDPDETLSATVTFPAQQHVIVDSGTLTGITNAVTVGGTVAVSNFPATQPVSGTVAVSNFPDKTALTASAPTAATVGVASAQAVAANANRKGMTLKNTSTNNISIGLGAVAVLNSGITLLPGEVWEMDQYTFTTAAVNAIAAGAGSNMSIQEFT